MKHLFEYVVLHHEHDKHGDYVDSKIVINKSTILAKSEKEVMFHVTRQIPEEFAGDPDNVEILIRNF